MSSLNGLELIIVAHMFIIPGLLGRLETVKSAPSLCKVEYQSYFYTYIQSNLFKRPNTHDESFKWALIGGY